MLLWGSATECWLLAHATHSSTHRVHSTHLVHATTHLVHTSHGSTHLAHATTHLVHTSHGSTHLAHASTHLVHASHGSTHLAHATTHLVHASTHRIHSTHLAHTTSHGGTHWILLLSHLELSWLESTSSWSSSWHTNVIKSRVFIVGRMRILLVHLVQILDVYCLLVLSSCSSSHIHCGLII